MTNPYFAYGSNLCVARLQHRVPAARLISIAELRDHTLRWHKRSADGSGKCTVQPEHGARVFGAIFLIPASQRHRLDQVEGLGDGYDEVEVMVRTAGKGIRAWTYIASSTHIDDSLRPYDWYRDLVIAGAEALRLPETHIAGLRAAEAVPDPDADRERRNTAFLPCS